jgi:nucleotide-binding universal stress UspA family protein
MSTDQRDAVGVQRIVVGVDGSNPSRRALRWAADQALRWGATLEAVMSVDDPLKNMWVPHDRSGPGIVETTRKALERTARSVLGDSPEVKVELLAIEGPPAKALIEASEGCDLLVVGSRGLGGFAGLVMGSVSLQCVSHAPCPVVVVR